MPPTVIAQETGTAAVRTMAPVQQPIAILANVTKRYGATIALDGLSLALRPGEVVALLGPNGAGKSTAVRLLLGLIAPNTGTARVFGSCGSANTLISFAVTTHGRCPRKRSSESRSLTVFITASSVSSAAGRSNVFSSASHCAATLT